MTDRRTTEPRPQPQSGAQPKVNIDELTRAVERLLRRDLKLAQERLHGGKQR